MDNLIKKNHSGLGIATFCIAIISISSMLISSTQDIIRVFSSNGVYYTNNLLYTNILFAIGAFLSPVGAGLGIAAILQKGKKKSLAIPGFVINTLITIFGLFAIL